MKLLVKQPVLSGDKAQLVPLSQEHLAQSLEWVNDPFIMSSVLRVLFVTWEDQLNWYSALKASDCCLVWAILDVHSKKHVGNTGLYSIDSNHKRAEFWIYLGDPQARGTGIGSQALALTKSFAFGPLGLMRLFLHVGVDNLAARHLYERHGFRLEGILRHHYIIENHPVDVAVMSILKNEYDQIKHPG